MAMPATGVLLLLAIGAETGADEIFSGPQVGEKLPAFQIRHVFDEQAGKTFDPIKVAADKPVALVFVHEFTRPSVQLVRAIMNYAGKRKKDGLTANVVFLTD